MGTFFVENEVKKRPGGYKRYTTDSGNAIAAARDGVCACVLSTDWGTGDIVTIARSDYRNQAMKAFGMVPAIVSAMIEEGVTTLYCVRANVSSTDTPATITLAGKTSEDESGSVTISEKYSGKLGMHVTVRASLADDTKKELIVYNGDNEVLETITFTAAATGIDESDTLYDAIKADSSYITMASKPATAVHTITAVANSAFTETAPATGTTVQYAAAADKLAPYYVSGIAIDKSDTSYTALLRAYIDNVMEAGKKTIAVIGVQRGTGGMSFSDVLAYSRTVNNPFIVVLGDTYTDADGDTVDYALAAARTLAAICAQPSSQAITHQTVTGAAGLRQDYTDYEYTQAIEAGVLMLSKSPDGAVWYDSGVNTLTSLASNQDEGWKKIRRTRTRLELWDRLDRTLDPLVGQITNDDIGVANVIQLGQRVIDAMISERKLIEGTFELDEDKGYDADYAYFRVAVQDADSLEFIYQTYRFTY